MKSPAIDSLGARLIDSLRTLPKAELHLHIEGSLEPELMLRLGRKNGIALPYKTVEEARQVYAFTNLQSFLDIYYAGASVLVTEDDFYDLATAYFARAHADHILHAELFFDPQTHTARGIAIGTVIRGLRRACDAAKRDLGIEATLILCFLRHLSEADAFATLAAAEPFLEHLIGVGLDSSELGHPPEKFARVFARAAEMGLRRVAHAGEEGPPDYIWQALNLLGAERIDHGVQALRDPQLVAHLARERIPLTVCPLSNIKLKVFPTLAAHNLPAMLAAGLNVTLNSDDPAYFGGYLTTNFVEVFSALPLNLDDAYTLAKNSFLASFAGEEAKRGYVARLDAWRTRYA